MSDQPTHEGFTPGPWRIRFGPGDKTVSGDWRGCVESDNNDGYPGIASVWGYSREECDGNLKLIADAPRLLAENARLREALVNQVEALKASARGQWNACELVAAALAAVGEGG